MRRVPFYKGGPDVAVLGYGAMSFADFYGPATEEGSHAILDACLDFGIDHIDTSNVYGMGKSESRFGTWLAKRGGRNPFVVATKAGITRDADGNRRFDNSKAHLEAELEGSLRRMGIEAVDLFYVHRRDADVPIEEVAGALDEIVASGKARAVGFSEIAPSSLRRAAAVRPIAAVQSEYSLATRSPELGLVQECARQGAALVAFSPVGRGMLTDAPPDAAKAAGLPFLSVNPRFQSPNIEANLAATDAFRALAADLGMAASGLAIAWLLSRGDHVLPIPGTRSVAHLREMVDGARRGLSADEATEVEKVLPLGWAHGDRYSAGQWVGPERYC